MRAVLALVLLLWPVLGAAQTSEVRPGDLELSVTVEETGAQPLRGEMVLITIRGVYRRHITRESLRNPDFDGFSWAQLGPDHWTDERIDGRLYKVFQRRMALYPDRAGALTIGAFTHELTLTDEGDDWFDHAIRSEPVTIDVASAPAVDGWWFPVQRLRISDQWSNAPDQLKPGDGVLRVIQLEALGVTPEMIPPMPELTSPSAMIFPHPEKRFVELTPEGPVTFAFWRWTIRPTNDVSAIVEPISVSYFDTVHRRPRVATISPQRVAYGDATPDAGAASASARAQPSGPPPARLPGSAGLGAFAATLAGGVWLGFRRRRWAGMAALARFPALDPLAWRLHLAARRGDAAPVRRAAAEMLRRDGGGDARAALLAELDAGLFAPGARTPDFRRFARQFIRA